MERVEVCEQQETTHSNGNGSVEQEAENEQKPDTEAPRTPVPAPRGFRPHPPSPKTTPHSDGKKISLSKPSVVGKVNPFSNEKVSKKVMRR